MKIKGSEILVFFERDGEWKTLAFGTTCEIDINVETINVSAPFFGKFRKRKKKKIDWSVSSGHLLGDNEQAIVAYNLLKSSKEVKVLLGSVDPHTELIDAETYQPDGRFYLVGTATMTRMTITANRGDFATVSMTLDGSGALELKDYRGVVMMPEDVLDDVEGWDYLVQEDTDINDGGQGAGSSGEQGGTDDGDSQLPINNITIDYLGRVTLDKEAASDLTLTVIWLDADGEETLEKSYTMPKGTLTTEVEPYKDSVKSVKVAPTSDKTYRYTATKI